MNERQALTKARAPIVVIGCARSGVLARAFRAAGCEAWEIDRRPTTDPRNADWHIQGDVLWHAENSFARVDLFICHPPCTFLCSSGLHWNARRPERARETERAVDFFLRCASMPIERKALENPIGCMSTRWRRPDQIIQPWQFGDDASKATCLWLENMPPLRVDPRDAYAPRLVVRPDGRRMPRWGNQTDSGQNRLGPSAHRADDRARTYPGIALAMATQWTPLLIS